MINIKFGHIEDEVPYGECVVSLSYHINIKKYTILKPEIRVIHVI